MRGPYTELYLHCVWSTWKREPLITAQVEKRVYSCILTKCRELKCDPLAIGGIEDHVHLLVRFPTSVSVAQLLGEVKGASSHLMTHVVDHNTFFKWQGGYGAFTVGKSGLRPVIHYINDQKVHHAEGSLMAEWEFRQEEYVDEIEIGPEDKEDTKPRPSC